MLASSGAYLTTGDTWLALVVGEAWSENRSEGASFYFLDPDGHKLEIHVGDLASRLRLMKAEPWEDIEFFE